MSDNLPTNAQLRALAEWAADPTLPKTPLSQSMRSAGEQLACDLSDGTLGMMLSASDWTKMANLSLDMLRWADRAEALEAMARPSSRRERQMTPIGRMVARIVRRLDVR